MHKIGLITQDILVTIGAVSKRFPAIYRQFQHGNFSTWCAKGKCNMLPPDQVIEQTINKDQKGLGGIIGISTSQDSMQRWVVQP